MSRGDRGVRRAAHAVTGIPRAHALLALLLLQAARFPARVSSDGELYLLRDQDHASSPRRRVRATAAGHSRRRLPLRPGSPTRVLCALGWAAPTNLRQRADVTALSLQRLTPFSGCAAALGVGGDGRLASCLSALLRRGSEAASPRTADSARADGLRRAGGQRRASYASRPDNASEAAVCRMADKPRERVMDRGDRVRCGRHSVAAPGARLRHPPLDAVCSAAEAAFVGAIRVRAANGLACSSPKACVRSVTLPPATSSRDIT